MKIDEKAIRHLEALARIELDDGERARLAKELDRIIGYVRQLQAIDTEGIEPTSAVVHQETPRLRADEPRPGLDREIILGGAPDRDGVFFRVPKIIER